MKVVKSKVIYFCYIFLFHNNPNKMITLLMINANSLFKSQKKRLIWDERYKKFRSNIIISYVIMHWIHTVHISTYRFNIEYTKRGINKKLYREFSKYIFNDYLFKHMYIKVLKYFYWYKSKYATIKVVFLEGKFIFFNL